MSLKSFFSNVGSKIKSAVQKVSSTVQNVATKVIQTVKDKSASIVQTISSVATGNVFGAISGVADILTPTKSTNTKTEVETSTATTKETINKSVWKNDYNRFTKMLRG